MKASELMIIIIACFASAILTAFFMTAPRDQLLSVVVWVLTAVLICLLCVAGLYGVYLARAGFEELGDKEKDVVQLIGVFFMATFTFGLFISFFPKYVSIQEQTYNDGTISSVAFSILAQSLPSWSNWVAYLIGAIASVVICYVIERQDLKDRLKMKEAKN